MQVINPAEESNKPTELDLYEEAIVHTQESVIADEEKLEHEEQPKSQEPAVNTEVGIGNKLNNQELRRSDRLKKDIDVTIQEKNERMARKRNLEGTYSHAIIFSDFPIENIKNLSSDIGIVAHKISFGTFNMLKDLENARRNLHAKTHEVVVEEQNKDENLEGDVNDRLIEWL